jgi:hypothetical protein
MITIIERNMVAFFRAPFNAYGAETGYVSPMLSDLKRFLSSAENPLFANDDDFTFFTAMRDGRPVGRITAHVHRASNTLHRLNRAYFGYFDCADDAEAATLLLGAAESWARSRGFAEIMGNFNLTAMQQPGVMTDGFQKPALYGPDVGASAFTASARGQRLSPLLSDDDLRTGYFRARCRQADHA